MQRASQATPESRCGVTRTDRPETACVDASVGRGETADRPIYKPTERNAL